MSYGIFVAGGEKDAGKTTLSLGLVSFFKEHLPRGAAFIKPIGQKTTMRDGTAVGEDSYLLEQALKMGISLEKTAPFSSSSGAAEQYIAGGEPRDIFEKVKKAFKYLSNHYDMVVVEGTGHPGVGSVFDLSNAEIAAKLDVPVILVLDGGIGSTIDRFTLCHSLFLQHNAKVLGVVFNRVLPAKIDKIKEVLTPWFEKRGIPVFGYIPYETPLTVPSLGVLRRELDAESIFMNAEDEAQPVSGYITAFGDVDEVLSMVQKNPTCALVLSATRSDIINAVLARKVPGTMDGPSALILCGQKNIAPWISEACQKISMPLFVTEKPSVLAVQKLYKKIFKVEPEEVGKIEEIIELVKKHVDMEAILKHLQPSSLLPEKKREKPKHGILFSLFRRLLRPKKKK